MTVLDVNDHVPVLSLDLYEFIISEDTLVNSRFPQIVATDNDATTNAQITYSIDITSEYCITVVITFNSSLKPGSLSPYAKLIIKMRWRERAWRSWSCVDIDDVSYIDMFLN